MIAVLLICKEFICHRGRQIWVTNCLGYRCLGNVTVRIVVRIRANVIVSKVRLRVCCPDVCCPNCFPNICNCHLLQVSISSLQSPEALGRKRCEKKIYTVLSQKKLCRLYLIIFVITLSILWRFQLFFHFCGHKWFMHKTIETFSATPTLYHYLDLLSKK